MAETLTTELSRSDEAFAGNQLLSTFADEARALIEPFGSVVQLDAGEVALSRGEQVLASLFPFDSTMISMAVELESGRSVEVALIGRRGAVGGIISCGQAPAFTRAIVLVGGPALRVPMKALEDAKFDTVVGPVTLRGIDNQSSMGAWVGKLVQKGAAGGMSDWKYHDGTSYMPSEADVKAVRKD